MDFVCLLRCLLFFCTIAVALSTSTGPHAVRQARKAAKQDADFDAENVGSGCISAAME